MAELQTLTDDRSPKGITADVKEVKGRSISFVNEDGRVVYEVRINEDMSLEVRGVELIRRDGVLYSESLSIRPRYSNSVEIHRCVYPETRKQA